MINSVSRPKNPKVDVVASMTVANSAVMNVVDVVDVVVTASETRYVAQALE